MAVPCPDSGNCHKIAEYEHSSMIRFDEDFVPAQEAFGVIIAMGGMWFGSCSHHGCGWWFHYLPMFVYIFGVSSMTTVGTDILQIIFTADSPPSPVCDLRLRVLYPGDGMLIGSLLGIQVVP